MVFIFCEGQTEERFVKEVVVPKYGFVRPKIIITGSGQKGGSVNYNNFIKQCRMILKNTQVNLLITLFDFAGLPKSWYEDGNVKIKKCPKEINKRIKDDFGVDCNRIFNVWSIYEFEILAFIDVETTCEVIGRDYKSALEGILRECGHNPEKINDYNYPSKRLGQIYKGYQKITDGITIAKKLGIEKIRRTNSFKRLFDKLDEIRIKYAQGGL